MKKIVLVLFLLALEVGAGAVAAFAEVQTKRFYDLSLAWEAELRGDSIAVSGEVQNLRFFRMHDLELTVVLLDGEEKVISRRTVFVLPLRLPMEEKAPFRVELPTQGRPPAALRFSYIYTGHDGKNDAFHGRNTFQVPLELLQAR